MTANVLPGQNVEFLFEENQAWRTSINDITASVDRFDYGNISRYFNINEAGRITSFGGGFSPYVFTFTISATGYKDVVVVVDFSK